MNVSLKGFLAESKAISELIARDFEVYRPVVDIYGNDVIIYTCNGFKRIQVRSLSCSASDGVYKFHCKHGASTNIAYDNDTVDFFMFYLVDVDLWYIIPNVDIEQVSVCIKLSETNKYNKYRDAWHLLEAQ